MVSTASSLSKYTILTIDCCSVVILNVIMLNAVKLNAIILSVLAPSNPRNLHPARPSNSNVMKSA
jgi:hypothetical protein